VRAQLRVKQGRDPEPSAGLIDSQSAEDADTLGRESRGYDAGKKINGRKRFIVIDTLGIRRRRIPWPATRLGADPPAATLHIVRKPVGQRGFAVIPRQWAVERTLAWLTAHRRLARDYERHPAVSEAMIRWAAINTITRRIARGGPATRRQRALSRAPLDLLKHVLSGMSGAGPGA
jgi:hypothetical protein